MSAPSSDLLSLEAEWELVLSEAKLAEEKKNIYDQKLHWIVSCEKVEKELTCFVGASVGFAVGAGVGIAVGEAVTGAFVGLVVGLEVGPEVGCRVGAFDGA